MIIVYTYPLLDDMMYLLVTKKNVHSLFHLAREYAHHRSRTVHAVLDPLARVLPAIALKMAGFCWRILYKMIQNG